MNPSGDHPGASVSGSPEEGTSTVHDATEPPFEHVTAVGMIFDWRVEGRSLRGRMQAPTTGWVTVGFNPEDSLAGSKLVMGYVAGDEVVVEEHIADPPNHRPKTQLGGHHAVSEVSGAERDGTTTIEFLLELDSGDPVDVVLRPGSRYHLTMAWSHEDDLYHHSARRTSVEIVL
ncbi:MAG: DOMON domain-containing protein [Nannocystaceae bacterium]